MADEFRRHGLGNRVHRVSLPVTFASNQEASPAHRGGRDKWRILFLGRMETIKGGSQLIQALPVAIRALRKPIRVTFAGDGRMRSQWEKEARAAQEKCPGLEFSFTGWVNEAGREQLFQTADLLVVPSLWPEPFGLVGIEAGHFGVPVAAFDVGGVSDWLREGVNGHVAPANPPNPAGLARSISQCLCDAAHHAKLQIGAAEMAKGFSMENHLNLLLPVLESAAG
jgi:glycosyltransferase involved in cell wall biosynthesis